MGLLFGDSAPERETLDKLDIELNKLNEIMVKSYDALRPIMKRAEEVSCDVHLNARQLIDIEAAIHNLAEQFGDVLPEQRDHLTELFKLVESHRKNIFTI